LVIQQAAVFFRGVGLSAVAFPHTGCEGEAQRQADLGDADGYIAPAPAGEAVEPGGHDQRAGGDADAKAGVQPLHQAVTVFGGDVGVDTGVDGAGAEAANDRQGDEQRPGRHQGIAQQCDAG